MQVIPHPVLSLLMALPFLATLVALNYILFQPLLQYLEERRQASASARAEAKRLDTDFQERISELETRLVAAREEVGAQRSEARGRAQANEAVIVASARSESDEQVSQAIREIAESRVQASATLRTTARSLSTDIASQVLGRQVSA